MKKRTMCLAGVLAALALWAGSGRAWAYFTTYAEAAGGYRVDLGDRTDVHEDFYDWTKHVTVSSEEGSGPVYIRAKGFCGSEYTLEYSSPGGRWTYNPDDGYCYYSEIVYGGETVGGEGDEADELLVAIRSIPQGEELEDGFNFNVVVIYESAPVQYHEDGSAYSPYEAATWETLLDTGRTEGGAA